MSSRVDTNWQLRLKEGLNELSTFYATCSEKGELCVFATRFYPDESITFQSGGTTAPPPEMAEKIKKLGDGMVTEHQGIADDMKSEGDNLKSKKVDKAELRKKIDEMKARLKKKSNDSIDRNGETLYEMLKDKDQSTADMSLSAWEGICGFFSGIWDKITQALFKAWEAVVNWFEGAWEAVEKAFKATKDWLVGAANTIKGWFS